MHTGSEQHEGNRNFWMASIATTILLTLETWNSNVLGEQYNNSSAVNVNHFNNALMQIPY